MLTYLYRANISSLFCNFDFTKFFILITVISTTKTIYNVKVFFFSKDKNKQPLKPKQQPFVIVSLTFKKGLSNGDNDFNLQRILHRFCKLQSLFIKLLISRTLTLKKDILAGKDLTNDLTNQ